MKNVSSGNVDEMMGFYSRIENQGSGTVNNAYGIYIDRPDKTGTGAISNWYGLYLRTPTGPTNSYSVYSQGGRNYFGGNVGIGTTSAGYALDAVSTATGTSVVARFASNPGGAGAGNLNALVLDNTNGASNYKNEIKFRGSGNDKWSIGTDPNGAGEQTFYIWDAVASLRRLTIISNGNVGVGTLNPAAKLDVAGEVKFGNTASACSGTTEGQQRYNSTSKKMEFCNGTAWTEFGSGSGGGLGVDQTWQTPTRAFNTTYQNSTGKPIMIAVGAGDRSPTTIQISTDGTTWTDAAVAGGYSHIGDTTVVIPNGLYYRCNGGTKIRWTELR